MTPALVFQRWKQERFHKFGDLPFSGGATYLTTKRTTQKQLYLGILSLSEVTCLGVKGLATLQRGLRI